jgi:hypothetical protein
MTDSYSPLKSPAPKDEAHVARLGDVRVLALTGVQLDAYEDPPGSGLYPGLVGRPWVLVTDQDADEGIYAESYPPGTGVEQNTDAEWIDGKTIWKITYAAASITPGVDGAALASSLPAIDTLTRFEGFGNLASNGSGGWVPLGGSGFAVTVRDDGRLIITGPDGVTLYKVHATLWYTK